MLRLLSPRSLALPLALAASAIALGSGPAARADSIVIQGARIDGVEIVEETYEAVRYKIHGSTQSEPAASVDKVIYEQQPQAYRQGEDLMKKGRFADAAKEFESAARGRGWVRQYGLFFAAECKRLSGQNREAADGYRALLQAFPKTRFYPAAKLGLGLGLAASGDNAGAHAAFSELERDAKQKKLGQRWLLEAQLHRAQSLETSGSRREAAALYRKLARTRRETPRVGFAAELGVLRTSGSGDKLVQELQRLIDEKAAPDAVRADAYLELGRAQAKAKKHREALLAFLRVCYDGPLVRFPQARAESLYHAATELALVKTPGWEEKAAMLRAMLRKDYPRSPWAKK